MVTEPQARNGRLRPRSTVALADPPRFFNAKRSTLNACTSAVLLAALRSRRRPAQARRHDSVALRVDAVHGASNSRWFVYSRRVRRWSRCRRNGRTIMARSWSSTSTKFASLGDNVVSVNDLASRRVVEDVSLHPEPPVDSTMMLPVPNASMSCMWPTLMRNVTRRRAAGPSARIAVARSAVATEVIAAPRGMARVDRRPP